MFDFMEPNDQLGQSKNIMNSFFADVERSLQQDMLQCEIENNARLISDQLLANQAQQNRNTELLIQEMQKARFEAEQAHAEMNFRNIRNEIEYRNRGLYQSSFLKPNYEVDHSPYNHSSSRMQKNYSAVTTAGKFVYTGKYKGEICPYKPEIIFKEKEQINNTVPICKKQKRGFSQKS